MEHLVSLPDIHDELEDIIEYIIGEDVFTAYATESQEFFKYIYNILLIYDKEGFLMQLPEELGVLTQELKMDHIALLRLGRLYDHFYLLLKEYLPNDYNKELSIIEYKVMSGQVVNLLLKEEVI